MSPNKVALRIPGSRPAALIDTPHTYLTINMPRVLFQWKHKQLAERLLVVTGLQLVCALVGEKVA